MSEACRPFLFAFFFFIDSLIDSFVHDVHIFCAYISVLAGLCVWTSWLGPEVVRGWWIDLRGINQGETPINMNL